MIRIALLVVCLLSAAPAPGAAQTVFLDVNGDGRCDGADLLTPAVRSVDVWFVTDRNADGGLATCAQEEGHAFTIFSYTFVLRAWGDGTVAYGAWIPGAAVAALQVDLGSTFKGTDCLIAYGGMDPLDPGPYKVGTLRVTVTGSPRLSFLATSPVAKESVTGFGSECPGGDYDATIKLGSDFIDAFGTAVPSGSDGVRSPWAVIQRLYH